MFIQTLRAEGVRNLENVAISPHPSFNLILGPNGSGKSSLLEAIHLLSLGRSFRCRDLQNIINHSQQYLSCFAKFRKNEAAFSVGLQKKRNSKLLCQYNAQSGVRLAEFIGKLASQCITPDSFSLLTAGPEARRKFLDLGVFHVKHQFVSSSIRYKKLLKQRNAILKQANSLGSLNSWNELFVDLAEQVSSLRQEYLEGYLPVFQQVLESFLPSMGIHYVYQPGWSEEKSFREALDAALEQDVRYKTTSVGPHRADIKFTVSGYPAHHVLSRGQQKLFVCAMILAQALYLKRKTDQCAIFLIDDMASELDSSNLQKLLHELISFGHQIFITSVEEGEWRQRLSLIEHKRFHVEHGSLIETQPSCV